MDSSKLLYLVFGFSFLILTSCGGGGSNDPDPAPSDFVFEGQFIDSAVEGISYQTATQSGTTNAAGAFYYRSGETVSFSVGDISLGSAAGASQVTPINLVPGATQSTHPQVINLIRFIQALDSDGNPDNGIQISNEIISLAAGQGLDFTLGAADFETAANALLSHLTSGNINALVNEAAALAHFNASLGIDESEEPISSIAVTGMDTSIFGATYSPWFSSLTTSDFGRMTQTQIKFSGVPSSLTVGIMDFEGGDSLVSALFISVGPGSTDIYQYSSESCTLPCNGLTIDFDTQEVTFEDFELIVSDSPDTNLASDSIILNGTLAWEQN